MDDNEISRGLNAEGIYGKMIEAGLAWADLNAAANLLEETKKTVLAKLMRESDATSAAGKEMYALADDSYRAHVTTMVTARKQADKARVRYDCAKVLSELRRSEESTRRAEMTLR